jgi:predicted Fe-Mo cluster-binding NifX family protein
MIPRFGRAPYFVIVKLDNGQMKIEEFYANEFLKETRHIGKKRVEEGISVKESMERSRLSQLEGITEPTHPVEESLVISQFQD